ncbi:hypothetical protein [Nocardia sp. NPDC049149]|uniref:hypothetical protein n=1 Tax=Nocardia sp. NPDC049149 TaxID=3364315 RepID=UPI00372254A2
MISPREMQSWASAIWLGKSFHTGPDGGFLLNRVGPAGNEAWPANVYSGSSVLDGQSAWEIDYAPSPTPQLLDEIREVTPGVWFGYCWSRGPGRPQYQLTFALA